jgi:hypothetical protein
LVDNERYRESGEVTLDSERARALGLASISEQDVDLLSAEVAVDGGGVSVSVIVVDTVELGLLGLLVDQTAPITVGAQATASPRFLP